MASSAKPPIVPEADLESFSAHLKSSSRILALLGAGLSASSGLPTFRGAGGLWRNHEAMTLATPDAFDENPGLVWQFYSYRRHMALKASPNPAHFALAELARRKEGFMTLSQNVDGLSQRANHPQSQLHLLHGSLFDVKCTSFYCNYFERNNYTDPIVPALAIPENAPEPVPSSKDTSGAEASASLYATLKHPQGQYVDISDAGIPIPSLQPSDLPQCPKCKNGLLRPGVVWFNEPLPVDTITAIDDWMAASPKIDLMLVIGTSAKVYPAAGYVDQARAKGARIAVVNMDREHVPASMLGKPEKKDWFFEGDAGAIVPHILESVIGELRVGSE